MARGCAKGLLFHHLEAFAKQTSGPAAYGQLVASLEPKDRELLSQIVLAGGWYPVGTWNRALEKYLRTFHEDPKKGMDEFAVFLGDRELRGVVKFVLKLGSPEFLLARTTFLWSRYFDQGSFGHEQVAPRHYRLWLDAPKEEDAAPSRFNCAHGPGPWLSKGLELAGCENGKVEHVRCRFDGGVRCEYRATW